jgi:hypothetical protein
MHSIMDSDMETDRVKFHMNVICFNDFGISLFCTYVRDSIMDSDMKTDRLKFHNQCCLLQRFGYFFVLYLCLSSCNALLFMFFAK